MYLLPGIETKENLLTSPRTSPWTGISNLTDNALIKEIKLSSEIARSNNALKLPSSPIEETAIKENGTTSILLQTSSPPSIVKLESTGMQADDELDMTGYSANFNLPAREL